MNASELFLWWKVKKERKAFTAPLAVIHHKTGMVSWPHLWWEKHARRFGVDPKAPCHTFQYYHETFSNISKCWSSIIFTKSATFLMLILGPMSYSRGWQWYTVSNIWYLFEFLRWQDNTEIHYRIFVYTQDFVQPSSFQHPPQINHLLQQFDSQPFIMMQ